LPAGALCMVAEQELVGAARRSIESIRMNEGEDTLKAGKGSHYFALPVGSKLFEFEIESVLGHGGFGITYLARDTLLQEQVAIKEYLPNDFAIRASDATVRAKSDGDRRGFQEGLKAFLEEARLLARFRHRNIVHVRRFFELHGTGYIVLDFERGDTLGERMDAKTLSELELRDILNGMIAGLEVVHARAILHRDLKPSNVILRDDGSPVLIDFGAARDFHDRNSRSVTAIASPGYSSPEQYGVGGQQGPWTDIYALGAIAYRAISGAAPADSLRRLRKDPLVPATEAGKEKYDIALLRTIDWMLKIDEAERPASVEQVREALQGKAGSNNEVQINQPAASGADRSPAPGGASRSSRPERRSGRVGIVAFLAFAAIVLSYGIYNFSGHQGRPPEPQSNLVAQNPAPTAIVAQHPAPAAVVAQNPAPVAGELKISGPEKIAFAGYQGETFDSNTVQINLGANGRGFNWTNTAKPDWLDLSQQSGTLSDNSSTTLSLKPNSVASSMKVGAYEGEVTFTGETPGSTVRVNASLTVKDPVFDCDRLMGNRFDPERPSDAPYAINTFPPTEDGNVDLAIRACSASVRINPGVEQRRYIAQGGRAYAVGAEVKATAGDDVEAQAEMKQAIQLWMDAAGRGNSAAMNSLGALWYGTYNTEVTSVRQKQNAPPFTFVAPNAQTALDYWLQGASAGNATSMRNAGVLLLGDYADPPPTFKDVPRALNLLNQAMLKGDTRSASILGVAYYYGTPKEVSKNPAFGLELLARACTESDAHAKEFFNREIQIRHRLNADQAPAGCGPSVQ
jgi:serine/threonine protein kinase